MNGKKIKIPLLVDLRREYQEIKKEIDAAVDRVIESGWFLFGKELTKFESELAKYLGVKYVVGVNSGTDALHLALLAVDIDPGDEVITVSHTFISTVLPIFWVGAKPALVDIDETTYNLDPEKIEAKITKKTKAILPVHLYGYPAAMDKIKVLARKYRLKVIEDACQAHGSMFKSRKLGTIGDVGCFSFYPTKNLGCYGDGGAVVTNNQNIANKLRLLRNYGEEKKYYYKIKGFNSRLGELQAAVLSVKLRHLDSWNKKRAKLANRYYQQLKDLPIILPPKNTKVCQGNYYVFAIKTKKRHQLQDYLRKKDICTIIHYPVPIHRQRSCRELLVQAKDLKITDKVARSIVSLPIFPQMTDSELGYICHHIRSFFNQ